MPQSSREVRVKEFLGEKRKYLVLRVVYGDLTVLVPIDSTDQVGLRPCVSKNEAKKILKVLTEDETSVAANWSRRFKNNLEKLHSGRPVRGRRGAAEPRHPRSREGACRPARSG